MLRGVARGIYSALGHWPEADLAAMLELLRALGRGIVAHQQAEDLLPAHPPAARATLVALIAEIRAFEQRVGAPTGLAAEAVTTPTGPAIEVGNLDHRAFGAPHEAAAAVVARAVAALLEALGGTGVFWFTMD